MQLTTNRLTLREYVEQDWQAVFTYQSDPSYLQYYPWHNRTINDAQNFVQKLIFWQREKPRVKFQLAIVLSEQNQLIGSCGVRMKQANSRQAELGYEIDPSYWGQGYATEAAQKMLVFGFRELKLHRIWATCLLENVASTRVLEKLGLQREGHLREHRWMKGRWWDSLVYSILEQEWQAHHSIYHQKR
jgi:RimJ/RimL family protein N-acetyltransferase